MESYKLPRSNMNFWMGVCVINTGGSQSKVADISSRNIFFFCVEKFNMQ
jgi:hypothetical protein